MTFNSKKQLPNEDMKKQIKRILSFLTETNTSTGF